MKLRKPILAFILSLAMITGNVPVWAAGEKAPLPAPDPGLASFDVTFVSRMPDRAYLTGGLPDETLSVAASAKVDKSLLTNADLKALAPGSVHTYGGKDYEFVGWYAHSTAGDFYSPVGAANGFDKLPAIEPGDMYGVLVPWDFDNGTVTLDKTLADYRHTNRVLYLYAKWKEKDAHENTVRFHLTDANGTPPPEKGVAVGGNWSTTGSALLPGTTPKVAGQVFLGWSTSDWRKPDGSRVLEIQVGGRIDARDEGADLYDVWVTPKDPKSEVTVDFSDEYQTMVGVGASWAFHKWNNFKYVYDVFQAQGYSDDNNLGLKAVKRYIDQEEGVGMDLVRLIIGDGGVINTTDPEGLIVPGARVPGIKNTVDGSLTWGDHIYDGANDTIWPIPPASDGDVSGIIWNMPGFDPLTYKQYGRIGFGDELFDEDQIWFAKKAVEINPDVKIYASLWSPPYWMKSNQNVRNDYWWNPMGDPKDERPMLLEKYYDEFAIYLAEYAYGMMKHYGVPIYALCPTNETEIAHGYSGYVFQGDDYQRFLKDYLYPVWDSYKDKFKEAYTDHNPSYPVPKIAAPEGTRMDRSTSPVDMGTTDRPGYGAMMSDEEIYTDKLNPGTGTKTSVFSTHLYEYNQYQWEARTAAPLNNTDPANEDPFHPSYLRNYEDIWMAEMSLSTVNSSLGTARFLGNLFGSDPGFTGVMWWWPTQTLGNGGNVRTSQPYTGQMALDKRYYVSGQYSRFINNGYVRVGIDDMYPFEGANVTAYKDGGDFVIIAVNETAAAKTLGFNLYNASGGPDKVVPYRTSPNENIRRLADIAISGDKFTAELPAYSVTSFVYHTDPAAYLPGLGHHIFTDVLDPSDSDDVIGTVTPATGGVSMADGSSVAFKNFNFAAGTVVTAATHVARINARGVSSAAGGAITAILGNPTGKVVATMKVTPGASDATVSAMLDTGDLAAYGFNDLYLTVSGDVTVKNFYFDGVQMAQANQLIASNAEDPAAAWTGANAAVTRAPASEASYQNNGVTFKVERHSADGGATQALAGAFIDGAIYDFKCQILGTDKSLTGAARPDATVVLAAYNGGVLVDSQPVASRSDLWALDWAQVDGSFTYAEPAAAYDKIQLEIRLSGTDSFYLANASLAPSESNPASSNANLRSLTVSQGTLTPAFSPLTSEYAVSVSNSVTSINISATPYYSDSTVEGAGTKALATGANVFTIKVTAADGVSVETYQVTVNRARAGALGPLTDPGSGSGAAPPSTTEGAVTPTTPGGVTAPGEPSAPAAGFADQTSVAEWAKPFFERLIGAGVISGYPADNTLRPKGNVTRAEFTKMIVAALKLAPGGTAKSFADVGAGDWYKEYVDVASANGIVNGVTETAFAPNANISRQDLCTIAYRALVAAKAVLAAPDGSKFSDDSLISDYAKDAVYGLKQLGVVSGRDTGGFDPAAFATREETAKIIASIMDVAAAASAASTPAAVTEPVGATR
ncbi:MAG: S-layer homology domain-containing protein [Clostridiales Family XIII bacterium]|nr:S-layer homology domain-containing protein [Clostridiales Family XIII bacterium]